MELSILSRSPALLAAHLHSKEAGLCFFSFLTTGWTRLAVAHPSTLQATVASSV